MSSVLTHISKEYKCDDCGKILGTEASLSKHKRIHSRDLPLKCNHCSASFSNQSGLVQHRASHSSQEFTCGMCNFKTHRQHALQVHMKTHSNETRMSLLCHICRSTLPNRTAKRTHMLKFHRSEMPHQCSMCDEAYRLLRDLEKHKKTKHKISSTDILGQAMDISNIS